jgi:hypothetical protein
MQRVNALQTDEDMLSDVIPDSKQISRQVLPHSLLHLIIAYNTEKRVGNPGGVRGSS